MELINTLGIDWRILIWQAVMFFVLLGILRKFAYGPVVAALTAREERIAKGLADAAAAEQARLEAEQLRTAIVADAHKESSRLIAAAKAAADTLHGETVARTRTEAERLLKDGQARLMQERGVMLASAEGELAGLVRLALEKVLDRAVTKEDHERLTKETLAALKSVNA